MDISFKLVPPLLLLMLVAFVEPVYSDVIINEFMASNDSTIDDEDGDASDWIELYNNGSAPADLGGWYLTDDETLQSKWQLPSVVLSANNYLLIFASKKDRVTGELHADFSLKAGGEYLGLIHDDGSTVIDEYAPEYPSQFEDQSYGAIEASGDGYLATPTPGSANSAEAIPLVEFSAPSGIFTDSLTLSLATVTPLKAGDVIRYTRNGQAPTNSSAAYISAITLSETTRLRARVFRASTGGKITFSSHIKLAPNVATFSSDLPIVVIDTLSQQISSTESYTPSLVTFIDTDGTIATLTDTPDFAGFSGIRIRGNSSRNFPKKQYKIELWDDTQEDFDANLLGLGKEADWVLYAPGRYDRNMISNPLMYKLSGDMGMLRMDTRFVEVYLNDGSGAIQSDDYAGLYMLTESIKIDKNRVPVSKMRASDTALPEISGGYLLSVDSPDDDELSFRTDTGFPDWSSIYKASYLNVVRPKLKDLDIAQENYIKGYIQDFEDTLYSFEYNDLITGYSAYIDVPSWIDAHILRLFAMDLDILRLSNYFYKDRNGKIFQGPLWDFDRTLNSDDARDDNPASLWNGSEGVDPVTWGWWGRLFESEHFDFRYRARWQALRLTVLSEANIFSEIDAMEAEIHNAYIRENQRWGSTNGYGSRYGDLSGEMEALKSWITERLTFLDTYWAVNSVNLLPAVTNPSDQMSHINETVSLQINSSDPEGDQLVYFEDGLPYGLTLNSATGVISGNPAIEGIYPVTMTVTDGKHDVIVDFTWVVDADTASIACGEPSITPIQERYAFLWEDCVGDGTWYFRAAAGGTSTVTYEGSITSTTVNLASSVIPYSFEGNDFIDSVTDPERINFKLRMVKNGIDGFQFRHDDAAAVCINLTLPDSIQLRLGVNKVIAGGLPLDLNTLTASTSCALTPPLGEECGVPQINSGAEKGVFIYKNCSTSQWTMRVTAGGVLNTIKYQGDIVADSGFSQVDGYSLEGNDIVDNTSSASTIDYTLSVIKRGVDGIDFLPLSSACLTIDTPTSVMTYLGAMKKLISTPINLTTLGSCDVTPPQSECGAPVFDSATEKGLFLWKTCDGSNTWHTRMTAGGDANGVVYTGLIDASQPFISVIPVGLSNSDLLDNTTDATQVNYQLKVWNKGVDGIDFIPPIDTCFDNQLPVGVNSYLGSNRNAITFPFNLSTLGGC